MISPIGIIGVTRLHILAGISALIELACARLLVCWVTLSGLVAYDVNSLAQGRSANLTNGNTSDSQTIDSITSNNNTSISNCPFKIMNTITLTIRITPMYLITAITKGRNNRTGITSHNNIIMRGQAQNQCERTCEYASITYVLGVQGSLGSDERLHAGRVTAAGSTHKCSFSLRSARSSYTHPTVLAAHLVPHAP